MNTYYWRREQRTWYLQNIYSQRFQQFNKKVKNLCVTVKSMVLRLIMNACFKKTQREMIRIGRSYYLSKMAFTLLLTSHARYSRETSFTKASLMVETHHIQKILWHQKHQASITNRSQIHTHKQLMRKMELLSCKWFLNSVIRNKKLNGEILIFRISLSRRWIWFKQTQIQKVKRLQHLIMPWVNVK